jgi:hypothetical protein
VWTTAKAGAWPKVLVWVVKEVKPSDAMLAIKADGCQLDPRLWNRKLLTQVLGLSLLLLLLLLYFDRAEVFALCFG